MPSHPDDDSDSGARRTFLRGSMAGSVAFLGAAAAPQSANAQSATLDPSTYGATAIVTGRPSMFGGQGTVRLVTIPVSRSYLTNRTAIRVELAVSYPKSTNDKWIAVDHGHAGFTPGANNGPLGKVILAGGLQNNPNTTATVMCVLRGEIVLNSPTSSAVSFGWNSYSGVGFVPGYWSAPTDYLNHDMEIVVYGALAATTETLTVESCIVEIMKGLP